MSNKAGYSGSKFISGQGQDLKEFVQTSERICDQVSPWDYVPLDAGGVRLKGQASHEGPEKRQGQVQRLGNEHHDSRPGGRKSWKQQKTWCRWKWGQFDDNQCDFGSRGEVGGGEGGWGKWSAVEVDCQENSRCKDSDQKVLTHENYSLRNHPRLENWRKQSTQIYKTKTVSQRGGRLALTAVVIIFPSSKRCYHCLHFISKFWCKLKSNVNSWPYFSQSFANPCILMRLATF